MHTSPSLRSYRCLCGRQERTCRNAPGTLDNATPNASPADTHCKIQHLSPLQSHLRRNDSAISPYGPWHTARRPLTSVVYDFASWRMLRQQRCEQRFCRFPLTAAVVRLDCFLWTSGGNTTSIDDVLA